MREYCIDLGWGRAVIDRGGQQLRAELDDVAGEGEHPPPDARGWSALSTGVRVYSEKAAWKAKVHPSVASATIKPSFTPSYALTLKAHFFNERFSMQMARMLHHGAGWAVGRLPFVRDLGEAMEELTIVETGDAATLDKAWAYMEAVRGLLDAALHIAGYELPTDVTRKGYASKWLSRFLRDPLYTKPTGIYAESEEMRRIYQFDRLLQTKLIEREVDTFCNAIESSRDLALIYSWHIAVIRRLSCAPDGLAVTEPEQQGQAFSLFPQMDFPGARLARRFLGLAPIPQDYRLDSEVISALRRGELETRPELTGNCDDHFLHANAGLLSVENSGLTIGPSYDEELVGRVRAPLGTERPPHIKRVRNGRGKDQELLVKPRITVEPTCEYYRRMAEGYDSLRAFLLEAIAGGMNRYTGVDDNELSVYDELCEMAFLFRGAWVTSCEELGLQPDIDATAAESARVVFRRWQQHAASDPDLCSDIRHAEPLWFDDRRRRFRVVVYLGVETRRLRIGFANPPRVQVFVTAPERDAFTSAQPQLGEATGMVLSPVVIECDLKKVPTRAELRAICDSCSTLEQVKAALLERF